MAGIEKKLAVFSNTVLKDAQAQKEALEKEIQREKDKAVHEHELECLADAYEDIQKAVTRYSGECNEEILKLEMQLKKEAIQKRETIIRRVFDEVSEKLGAFIASEEYPTWLLGTVQKAEEELGVGRKKVEVMARDVSILSDHDAEIVSSEEDFFGGARVYNLEKNTFCDYSITAILEEEHEKFLKISGLSIRA